jgi:hypothetical protein
MICQDDFWREQILENLLFLRRALFGTSRRWVPARDHISRYSRWASRCSPPRQVLLRWCFQRRKGRLWSSPVSPRLVQGSTDHLPLHVTRRLTVASPPARPSSSGRDIAQAPPRTSSTSANHLRGEDYLSAIFLLRFNQLPHSCRPGSYQLPGGIATKAKGSPYRDSPAATLSGRNKFGSPW